MVSSVCSNEKSTIFGKLGANDASPSAVVDGRGYSSWSSATEPSSLTIGIRLRSKRPSANATAARRWLSSASASHCSRVHPSSVAIRSADRPCGTCGLRGQQVFVVGVEAVGAVACRAAHRLDAGADDELLVAGADAHRGERHRLLARPAEAIQRDAGDGHRPSGVEHGHAADVVRVITGVRTVAADDVVDVDGVEPGAVAQSVEHLAEHLLRMEVGEAALALLADPTRRTNGVDDPGLIGCVASCSCSILRCGVAGMWDVRAVHGTVVVADGSVTVGRIASQTPSSSNPSAHSDTPFN